MENKFKTTNEMTPEEIFADEEAIRVIRERNIAIKAEEEAGKVKESFDWDSSGRTVDTGTTKVIAKERTEKERSEIEDILKKIKNGV